MFATILLTTIIGLIAFKIRYQSVQNKELGIKYFQVMEGEGISQRVKQSTRCINNMFEVPGLFYVIATLSIVFEETGFLQITLAWVFVVFRCIHAYILLTYNNVVHRMLAYWLAFFSMFFMWVRLAVSIS
ncbi:MAG: hypothetical protein ACJAUP_001308 [Cellvibrionaceae bacterium]|jgi:hypothetical protein